jgi:putative Mg2+ transporter-C (MgtC) family protein
MDLLNYDLLIRIAASIGLGFLLGLERELTNKYAGLRTHILVCLGACIFTLISIYGFPTFAESDNVIVDNSTGIRDTARVAAQVVSGIGFIGAGAVLRNGPMIIGLTTAATLWLSAAIGMTCGVGMYGLATIATIASVAVLTIIRVFERKILPSSVKKTRRFKITLYCTTEQIETVREVFISTTNNIEDFSYKKLFENPEKAKVSCTFEILKKKKVNDIYDKLTEVSSPDAITMQEFND